MISLRSIEKSYPVGPGRSYVLRQITLDIKEGEFVTIMGPSGAGKSTLLAILGMFIFLVVGYPKFPQQATNSGFGPDWDCKSTGSGEPVCLKRIDAGK